MFGLLRALLDALTSALCVVGEAHVDLSDD